MRRMVAVAGLGLALVACGGSSGGAEPIQGTGLTASCTDVQAGICMEHRGIDSFQLQQLQTSCPASGNVFSSAACTATGRLGRCVAAAGAQAYVLNYYKLDATELQLVKSSCTSAGNTWQDG